MSENVKGHFILGFASKQSKFRYFHSNVTDSCPWWFKWQSARVDSYNAIRHGPLTRYVKLWVARALGMPGTFSPPPRVSDPDMHHDTCVTHVPWCMPGPFEVGGVENVPGIPGSWATRISLNLIKGYIDYSIYPLKYMVLSMDTASILCLTSPVHPIYSCLMSSHAITFRAAGVPHTSPSLTSTSTRPGMDMTSQWRHVSVMARQMNKNYTACSTVCSGSQ